MKRRQAKRSQKQTSPPPEYIKPLVQQIRAVRERATSKKRPAESNRQPSIFVDEIEALATEMPVFKDQAAAMVNFEQALLASEKNLEPIPFEICHAFWDALEVIATEWQATAAFYERQIDHLRFDNAELSKLLYQAGTQIFSVKEGSA